MSIKSDLKADSILLITAFIWGLAFVFQRSGMDHVGPILFSFGRFVIGAVAIFVIWYWVEKPKAIFAFNRTNRQAAILGIVLTVGMVLQQAGLLYTTAGRAGFLTGIYIIFVPLLGLFFRNKTEWPTWAGILLAIVGLYFLAHVQSDEFFAGDLLVLASSVVFALHLILTKRLAEQTSSFRLVFVQFLVGALLTLAMVPILESWHWQGLLDASGALLYVGVMSSAIAFYLMAVGLRSAPASHGAIILSFEAVFAALCGWWLLNEYLSGIEMLGCAFILAGGLVSQLKVLLNK
jgi:drug/metabolite transporter (DMT)-like permease